MKLIPLGRKQQLEKISNVKEELVQAQDIRNTSLETSGETMKRKEKDSGEVLAKTDLARQHPMITSHIFLRSMKWKFHCAKKN